MRDINDSCVHCQYKGEKCKACKAEREAKRLQRMAHLNLIFRDVLETERKTRETETQCEL